MRRSTLTPVPETIGPGSEFRPICKLLQLKLDNHSFGGGLDPLCRPWAGSIPLPDF